MKLLLIRHGDPDYKIDSLTEKGHREAQLLAEKMQHVPVKAFYVSPLGRARATIDYTLKKTGREATILDWMEEFPATLNPQESIGLKNAYGTHKNTVNRVVWDMLPEYWMNCVCIRSLRRPGSKRCWKQPAWRHPVPTASHGAL